MTYGCVAERFNDLEPAVGLHPQNRSFPSRFLHRYQISAPLKLRPNGAIQIYYYYYLLLLLLYCLVTEARTSRISSLLIASLTLLPLHYLATYDDV